MAKMCVGKGGARRVVVAHGYPALDHAAVQSLKPWLSVATLPLREKWT